MEAGVPRAGLVLARTPGWTPIGCRREPLGARAGFCGLRGGRLAGGRSTAAQSRILRTRTPPELPAAQSPNLRKQQCVREWDPPPARPVLPLVGWVLLLADRHRGLREVSARRLAASAPDQDRSVRGLTGVALREPEGSHLLGRLRPGFRLRGLVAGPAGARQALRHRCRAALRSRPTGVGVLRAGAGTGIGRRGRALAGLPARSGVWARSGPGGRVHPWPRPGPWTGCPGPRAAFWGCGRP